MATEAQNLARIAAELYAIRKILEFAHNSANDEVSWVDDVEPRIAAAEATVVL